MPVIHRVALALADTLAVGTLFLAIWIFVPAFNDPLIYLGVGAPEVSAWLIVSALGAVALAMGSAPSHAAGRAALVCGGAALLLALTPFARFPAAASRFDSTMRLALGGDPLRGVSAEHVAAARQRPLSVIDLFRGIPLGDAEVLRGIPVAAPDGVALTVDVYRPSRAGTFPTVVQLYGGSWQRGAPGSNAGFARWLAARGYVVFAMDYRHAPRSRWPAQIDDVRADLAWVKEHAAEYGADPTRVALLGRSAGAHLAMIAGYTDAPLPVSAVVSFYGPSDLVDAYAHPPRPDPLDIRTIEETLLGGTPAQMPDRYRDASPITYVTRKLPPTLLVYGGRDHIVEARYGRALRDRLVASRTTTVYLEIPWAEHAFDEVLSGPSGQIALYHTERFLAWALAGEGFGVQGTGHQR